MGGRRPDPTALKKLRGFPGKRKVNKNEPEPTPGDPLIPEGLSDAAKEKCREVISQLREMRVLTPADSLAVAAIGFTFDIWMRANDDIREFGPMIKSPVMGRKGTPDEDHPIGWIVRKNPAVAIANEQLKTMKSYMIEVGLTPASRGKLHVEKPKVVDSADEYFERKLNAGKHVN